MKPSAQGPDGNRRFGKTAKTWFPSPSTVVQRGLFPIGHVRHRVAAGDLAYKGACRVLAEHERTVLLTGEDRRVFVEALLNPPNPSKHLIAAVKRHRELFG